MLCLICKILWYWTGCKIFEEIGDGALRRGDHPSIHSCCFLVHCQSSVSLKASLSSLAQLGQNTRFETAAQAQLIRHIACSRQAMCRARARARAPRVQGPRGPRVQGSMDPCGPFDLGPLDPWGPCGPLDPWTLWAPVGPWALKMAHCGHFRVSFGKFTSSDPKVILRKGPRT